MEMQEFSPPREEFSAIGQEFASPAPEFSPPAPENCAVPEVHTAAERAGQADAPVRGRKKKRIDPLMLTSAAVAAATVVLAGVDIAVPGVDIFLPASLTLSAEHREYADALVAALDARDLAGLQLLEDDPRLPALAKETAAFMASLPDGAERPYCSYTDERNFDFSSSYYDGRLSPHQMQGQTRNLDLDVFYSASIDSDSHYLATYEYGPEDHDMLVSRSYTSNRKEDGRLLYLSLDERYCEITEDPYDSTRAAVPYEGTIWTRQYFDDGVSYTQWETSGTAASEHKIDAAQSAGYFVSYLENGTQTVTLCSAGQSPEVFVFEVIDGVTQLDGTAEVRRQENEDGPYFWLSVTRADGTTYSPVSGYADSEEDFLYHMFYFS